jgi:hypothetical protein
MKNIDVLFHTIACPPLRVRRLQPHLCHCYDLRCDVRHSRALTPNSDDHNHTQSGRREPDLCLRKCLILPANWLQKEEQHIPCRAVASALVNLASLRFSCEEVPEGEGSHE